MRPMKCGCFLLGVTALFSQGLATDTFGQAVAFDPIVGMAPSGQTMTVTPAVSADRRYVRLSVNAFFNTVNGFSSFTTPLGAVSGSGSGGGGLGGGGLGGGLGGLGGGLGGLGGGLRSVGGFDAGGVTFNAGMNGVIGPAGFDNSFGFAPGGYPGQIGDMRAGALSYGTEFGDGRYAGLATGRLGQAELGLRARPSGPAVPATAVRSPSESSPSQRRLAANGIASHTRSAIPKSVLRREKARSAHEARRKKASDEEPVIKPKAPSQPESSG